MLFRVSNLGPIREAELDLSKELIVLTGPNNTGKTYLTWAVYGLVPPPLLVLQGHAGAFQRWVDEVRAAESSGRPVSDVKLALNEFLDDLAADLLRRLSDEFASSPERFRETKATLRHLPGQLDRFPRSHLAIGEHQYWIQIEGEQICLAPSGIRAGIPEQIDQNTLRQVLSLGVWSILAGALLDFNVVVFPVERLAINLFARELAANRTQLVDQLLENTAGSQELLRRRAGRYPRAIRDALQRALKLRSGDPGSFADLADELEGKVLGGKLSKTEFDELEFTPANSSDAKPLGLHQSASVIKSLASLVWHLRYDAIAGQRLIIDEPELNLHPDNQRRVARVLAKAVNRGLKIMMSTHSDYLVRELNNLIMLSQDSDAARGLVQELGIDPESTIRPDKLGVYLVHAGECRSVPVTDTGFEVKTIDEEIHRLNRDTQTIFSRLFDE